MSPWVATEYRLGPIFTKHYENAVLEFGQRAGTALLLDELDNRITRENLGLREGIRNPGLGFSPRLGVHES